MSKYAFAAAAALSALIASSAAMAAGPSGTSPLTADFKVSITIDKGCEITTEGNITFTQSLGIVPIAPTQSAGAKAKVTCTAGTDYSISAGSNNSFKMVNDANKASFGISYTLTGKGVVAPADTTLRVMSTAGVKLTAKGDGDAHVYDFSGVINGWNTLTPIIDNKATKYEDVVTLTLEF